MLGYVRDIQVKELFSSHILFPPILLIILSLSICSSKKILTMPSRKRNKGKDRKVKKAEMKAEAEKVETYEIWKSWALGRGHGVNERGELVQWRETATPPLSATTFNICNHREHVLIPGIDHPVSKYLNVFFNGRTLKRETFVLHAEVHNNDSYRKMAIHILVSVGTNFLTARIPESEVYKIADAIAFLENYEGDFDSAFYSRRYNNKLRDLNLGLGCSIRRDILKFFSKRIACSCLKEMYSDARRSLPKVGQCNNCGVIKERVLLSVCSRCRIAQYCSRECQVYDWSRHKKCECDGFVSANKQQQSK